MSVSVFLERREALRDALGGPRALAYLAAQLEEERRQAMYRPGRSFDETAWHAGRVAVLEDLVRQLEQLKKE